MNRKSIPVERREGQVLVPERLSLLNQQERHAVLATDGNGRPYTSLIAFACTPDMGHILFATPRRTSKYRNIRKNSHVSLLIDSRSNTERDYLQAEAITISGTAAPVRRGKKWQGLVRHLTHKHPDLAEFVSAPTTALMVVEITECFHVGQFQIVSRWVPKASGLP
ncbi:MAG: pyridoxamine 5'-phosphate oxidase family protein [bacterium]|nr:pyridoxamine 5'-phosphate oxidase family protein [bacterium]